MTSALDGGGWSASHPGRRKIPRYLLCRRLGRPQSRSGPGSEERERESEKINTIKIQLEASTGVGLKVNTDETKYMLLSRHQNV